MTTQLIVERVLVTRGSHILLEKEFRSGVNIIHGSNGSGKSTIADFIFYGLGGELKEWKESASRAEHVHIQILTPNERLALRREISTQGGRPMDIFFGELKDGLSTSIQDWQNFPYRRAEGGYSFSQILFRYIGIPESISDGSSNITMHQLLRILYVDQLTPMQRIFRVENFDTWQTRQAVGDLLLGIGGYEIFQKQLELRSAILEYKEIDATYRSLRQIASGYGENILLEHIVASIANLEQERREVLEAIEYTLSGQPDEAESDRARKIRNENIRSYNLARRQVRDLEDSVDTLKYEIVDSEHFIKHLKHSIAEFDQAELTFSELGHLSFDLCPACFSPVKQKLPGHCELCDAERTIDRDDSRTLAVRLDLEMQLKESSTLQEERTAELSSLTAELRLSKAAMRKASSAINDVDDVGFSGRERRIAELSRKAGFIDSQIEGLQKRQELAKRIADASQSKEDLNNRINRLKLAIDSIIRAQDKRKRTAYALVSERTKALLDRDVKEHSDFGTIDHISFSFADDWMAINDQKNLARSASGMVLLKNSFALGMFISSLFDQQINLPRWMMFDNIEDKGMVEVRSWNFQRLIVEASSSTTTQHQIIFTTSMLAPELVGSEFVVGGPYTQSAKSLN